MPAKYTRNSFLLFTDLIAPLFLISGMAQYSLAFALMMAPLYCILNERIWLEPFSSPERVTTTICHSYIPAWVNLEAGTKRSNEVVRVSTSNS
jgi:hypothetical protein